MLPLKEGKSYKKMTQGNITASPFYRVLSMENKIKTKELHFQHHFGITLYN